MKYNVIWQLILHKLSTARLNNDLFPNTLLNDYTCLIHSKKYIFKL